MFSVSNLYDDASLNDSQRLKESQYRTASYQNGVSLWRRWLCCWSHGYQVTRSDWQQLQVSHFSSLSLSTACSCWINSFLKGSLSSRTIQFSAPANYLDIFIFTANSPPSLSPALPSAECDIELPSAMQEVNVMLVQEAAFLCSAGKFKGPLCAPPSFLPLALLSLDFFCRPNLFEKCNILT